MTILGNSIVMFLGSSTKIMEAIFSSAKIPTSFPPWMVIGKIFPVAYGFPKPVPAVAGLAVVLTGNPLELIEDEFRTFAALVSLLKLLMPLLLAGVDVFEIIFLLSAVNVVPVAPGGAAITVLVLSFAVAGLAVIFAVAGLAVILPGNPLELIESEFRTFALVNVARRIIKAIETNTTAINGI
ncbi:MAG: hypothetical protein WCC17_23445 [Candidatus Nitrosopolaris sp.]